MSPSFHSKLPHVGSSIFSVMSRLAAEHKAINLAQGFPDFPPDPELIELVHHYMLRGYNQYAPMRGVLALREQIASKINLMYTPEISAEDITITCGATQAIYTSIAAMVSPGDEVILIEPAYDSYGAAVKSQKGTVVAIPLTDAELAIDIGRIRDSITPQTRMIVLNSPHNPTGKILYSPELLEELADMAEIHDLIVLSDEVYESMVYDDRQHCSVLGNERLRQRSFCTFSFGKTYHCTGWKMGYVVAPPSLMQEFCKHHQFTVFSVHHATQHALADYLQEPTRYLELARQFQEKRDLMGEVLEGGPLRWLGSEGTYFGLAEYSKAFDMNDVEFAQYLTREAKVAVIPLSPFYTDAPEQRLVRLCFAKTRDTLLMAGEALSRL